MNWDLAPLIAPRAVAVIGASERNPVGRAVMENFTRLGFDGEVAGVHPRCTMVGGHRCFPTVGDLPFTPDCVIAAVRASAVVPALHAVADAGARAAVVFAMGFAESGADGARLQGELRSLARQRHLPILGPNCAGLVNFLQAAPLYLEPVSSCRPGHTALISQSGSLADALVNNARGLRWSHVVTTGNEAVVDCTDVVRHLLTDSRVRIICAFLEALRRPTEFIAACREAREAGKPVIVLKSGRSSEARRAALAHTGALAGDDRLFTGILQRAGVIRVRSCEEMLETAVAFHVPVLPSAEGVGVVAGSGGLIQMVLDSCKEQQLHLPALAAETEERYRPLLPSSLPVSNPQDYWGADDPDLARAAVLDAMTEDPAIGTVVLAEDVRSRPIDVGDAWSQAVNSASAAVERNGKPVIILSAIAGELTEELTTDAVSRGVSPLQGVDAGFAAVRHLLEFRSALHDPAPNWSLERLIEPGRLLAERSGSAFSGLPALRVLQSIGLHVAHTREAETPESAVQAAREIGYPVTVKVGDPEVLHKATARAVYLRLRNDADVLAAAETVLSRGHQHVLVQEHITAEAELLIGLTSDQSLGSFVLAGLGGVWAEQFNDVAVRPVGLSPPEPRQMLDALQGIGVLTARRGEPPLSRDSVESAIAAIDQLGRRWGHLIESLDINPLLVTPTCAVAVDAVVVLRRPLGVVMCEEPV